MSMRPQAIAAQAAPQEKAAHAVSQEKAAHAVSQVKAARNAAIGETVRHIRTLTAGQDVTGGESADVPGNNGCGLTTPRRLSSSL